MFVHDGESIPKAPSKDPDSVIDYGCDWSGWLRPGEVISSSVWLTTPGLTIDSSTNSDAITSVILSGGSALTEYTLTNRITTSLGRIEDRSMKITAREK